MLEVPEGKYNLFIVYFINCLLNSNYFTWLEGQLKYVTDQIDENAHKCTIHIIAITEEADQHQFMEKLQSLFPKILFKVEFYDQNEHEYRGINRVWEIGQTHKNRNDVILYFHSRGITHRKTYKPDKIDIILKDFIRIFKIFNDFSQIDKIGYSCSDRGWIWYNFWYARGSYINKVEKPIKTDRRHYYEDWLSRKVKNKIDMTPTKEVAIHARNDSCATCRRDPKWPHDYSAKSCYSFHTHEKVPNIGFYYCPEENTYLEIMD